ncbi:TonB-dependent receptor [Asticcacaulis endophyticus]|uniref:TonB-dependent receptor n=1 Tax=Asticcacaulis endophyticus TaxID=1395890 RepID=A0A918PVN0_9CAUL|nr:TonB-dependent receptor [Asticcacaulis endophyticus]GGZ23429.1 TonB-dependent receptor [Asticcacaulis endophyticus]
MHSKTFKASLGSARALTATAITSVVAMAGAYAVPAYADTEDVTEVVVTAQKRAEPLATTPLSVAVVTGDQLRQAGAHDLKDLQSLTPSLIITSTANEAQTTARLRGIGTVGDNPGLESSVGVVIDGVVRARTATAMSDLGEVDRVEILKGPQSGLFGKGASAGLIQVVTKAPEMAPRQTLELTAGEHGTLGVSGYAAGPLSDTVAGSLNLTYRSREGQYKVHTGNGPRSDARDNDQNYYSVRGQLLFTPNDTVTVRVIGDYTKRDENCCAGVAVAKGATSAYIDLLAPDSGVAQMINIEGREVWSNRSTAQSLTDTGLSVETVVRLSDTIDLTSITAARHWDHTNGYDADFSSADIYYREPDGAFGNRFDTLSQELRVAGRTTVFDWMVGLYLSSEDLERHDQYIYGSAFEPYLGLLLSGGANINRVSQLTGRPVGQSFVAGEGMNDVYNQKERNIALFTDNSWHVTQAVTATLSLRVNKQDQTLISRHTNSDSGVACAAAQTLNIGGVGTICQSFANPAFNALSYGQSHEEEATTGSFRVKWQTLPSLMTYASYARGWKGAGYNLDREQTAAFAADTDTAFAAETSESYEIGLKGRWWRGRLALDAAVFDQAFEDFQLNTFLGTSFLVKSIPELKSRGVELETRYSIPSLGLKLWGGATFAEAQFGPQVVVGLPALTDRRAAFAPKWSVTSGVDYQREVANWTLRANLTARYNSAYNTGSDLAAIKIQDAFTLLNGRLSLLRPDDSVAVELWGQNLTDETYYQVVFGAPFQSGTFNAFLSQPRTIGLTVRLKR